LSKATKTDASISSSVVGGVVKGQEQGSFEYRSKLTVGNRFDTRQIYGRDELLVGFNEFGLRGGTISNALGLAITRLRVLQAAASVNFIQQQPIHKDRKRL
jgi:hypothetical protein